MESLEQKNIYITGVKDAEFYADFKIMKRDSKNYSEID
jgi:hypothetical protein